jgi:hypothetical protein
LITKLNQTLIISHHNRHQKEIELTPIHFQNLSLLNLSPEGRYVTKKGKLFIENGKPNIFIRFWRQIRGQYNQCKIARIAMSLFGDKNSNLEALTQKRSIDQIRKSITNARVLVDAIPRKKRGCRKTHQELSHQLDAIKEKYWNLPKLPEPDQPNIGVKLWDALKAGVAAAGEGVNNVCAATGEYLTKAAVQKAALAGVKLVAGEAGTVGLAHLYQAINNPKDVTAAERVQHGLAAVSCIAFEGFKRSVNPLIGEARQVERAADLVYGEPAA